MKVKRNIPYNINKKIMCKIYLIMSGEIETEKTYLIIIIHRFKTNKSVTSCISFQKINRKAINRKEIEKK
jgi:hypothetical protein